MAEQAELDGSRESKLGILADLLGFQLQAGKTQVFDSFEVVLNEHDLTPRLFGMLAVIEANVGINQTELSGLLGIDRSQTVRDLDRLEQMNLVRRTRAKSDRRIQNVSLQPAGKKLTDTLIGSVRAHERAVTTKLTQRERKQLLVLLQKLLGTNS